MRQWVIVGGAAIAVVIAGSGILLYAGTSNRGQLSSADHPAPAGMVYVPGGQTQVGSNEGTPDERPVFREKV